MNLSHWIERHAQFTPTKVALRCGERAWTYRELHLGIDQTTAMLAAQGVVPGDRVAHLGYNSAEQLLLLFACARLGAMFVPLSWRLAQPEHRAMLTDCQPRVLVVEPPFVEATAALGEVLSGMRGIAVGAAPLGWQTWDGAQASAVSTARATRAHAPAASVSTPQSPVLLCYTSGSTGQPKGVVLTQEALFFNAVNSAHMHDMTSADVVLTSLPLFHVGGLNIQTLPALHAGANVIVHPRFEPGAVIDALQTQGVTLTVLVPAQLDLLAADPRWATLKAPSLRAITTGSTIIGASAYRQHQRADVPLLQVYGATETCPIAAYQRAADAPLHPGSVGKAALHCELRLVDDVGQDVAPGASGEIWVRGPNVMKGYWRKPAETQAALTDGWYRSGDVGHQDAEGFLYVDGRCKDVIISGGENIYPAELENILNASAEFAEVAVVGRPHERWGEAVVAVVVPKPGQAMTAERVNALLEGRVARYKLPREVVVLDSLPRTALGKLQREKLKAALRCNSDTAMDCRAALAMTKP
ncbi:class I adenylate-forming enzyme family protein [Rhodoferax sp.]|uniref:class I adenylate-forming enzyme family protein n=1 Tax=Rhodoferax sp. TaxID=50421 RepID=UPI00277ADB08|nr:AMP-binding protein [Rhodoferax sp.]